MYDLKIVRNYSNALYNNSASLEESESMLQELVSMKELKTQVPNLSRLLSSPVVNIQQKHRVFEFISSKLELKKKVKKFIFIILSNSRFDLFEEIVEYFSELYHDAANIKKAEVISPKSLTSGETLVITEYLESMLNKTVLINNTVDPSIIGGAIIKYDSVLIDCSIKGAINLLKNSNEKLI